MSKQGLSNKTRSYKPMIKNYWTDPQLTPKEQKEMIRIGLQYLNKKDVDKKE